MANGLVLQFVTNNRFRQLQSLGPRRASFAARHVLTLIVAASKFSGLFDAQERNGCVIVVEAFEDLHKSSTHLEVILAHEFQVLKRYLSDL